MKKLGLLLPVLAGIMFGGSGVFVRQLTAAGLDNCTLLLSRSAFAVGALLLFLLLYDKRLLRLSLRDLPLFLGTGIVGMLALNLCYNQAMNRLTLSLAAVLLSTAPLFVLLLAALLFRERLTGRKLLCLLLTLAGCVLATGLLEQGEGLRASPAGLGLGLASALFYALYSIFSRQIMDRGYHTYTVVFYSLLLMGLALLPWADMGAIGRYLSAAPIGNSLFLLAHALCTSMLPYLFITIALRHAEAGRVSILASGGEPIAAVVFGLLFYREKPSLLMLLGLSIVIAALALLCLDKKPTPRSPSS